MPGSRRAGGNDLCVAERLGRESGDSENKLAEDVLMRLFSVR